MSPGRESEGPPSNNGLHQTGRGGVAQFVRRGPVVEARPAGERECCTHSVVGRTDSACSGATKRHDGSLGRKPPSASHGHEVSAFLPETWQYRSGSDRASMIGWTPKPRADRYEASRLCWISRGRCSRTRHPAAVPIPSWRGAKTERVVASGRMLLHRAVAQNEEAYNNAMHLTKRVGAPASQAVVEARFAGDCGCCTHSVVECNDSACIGATKRNDASAGGGLPRAAWSTCRGSLAPALGGVPQSINVMP